MIREYKYYTLKYNPFTSMVMKLYLKPFTKRLRTLIFVATTGRSGSASLSKIFSHIPDCASFHEHSPIMNGAPLIRKNNGDDSLARFMYNNVRSIRIRRTGRYAKYYIDSNHVFIKCFFDYAIEDFREKVKVIHLYRHPVKVANSIYALNLYPGSEAGNEWWLDYNAPTNIIKIVDVLDGGSDFGHGFYKCLWYWYETEARIESLKKRYPKVPFIDFRTEDINDSQKLFILLNMLGISCHPSKLADIGNKRINLKRDEKSVLPLDNRVAEEMHNRFRDLLETRGYKLPAASG